MSHTCEARPADFCGNTGAPLTPTTSPRGWAGTVRRPRGPASRALGITRLPLALDSIRLAWQTIGIQGDAGVMFVTRSLTAQPTGCTVGQLFGPVSLYYPCPHAVYPGFPTPARGHSRRGLA